MSVPNSVRGWLTLALAFVHTTCRRKTAWVPSVLLVVLSVILASSSFSFMPGADYVHSLALLSCFLSTFPPLVYAAAFTDLATAGERLGVAEVERSTPVSAVVLACAHVAGPLVVTVTPALIALLACSVMYVQLGGAWAPLQAVAMCVVGVVPCTLLALALSSFVGALLPRVPAVIVSIAAWCLLVGLTLFVVVPGSAADGGFKVHLAADAVYQGFFGCSPLLDMASGSAVFGPAEACALVAARLVAAATLLALASFAASRKRRRK